MDRMKSWLLLVVAWVIPLAAQESRIEIQVALDSSGTILEISPELRDRAGLFLEVENFTAARLFRREDSLFILEIAFRQGGAPARQRTLMDATALKAFRRELSSRLAQVSQTPALNQEGRPGLIVKQTLMGLGFYGWSVPRILQIEGERETVATYMLVGSAGFALPYYLTRNRPVTKAQSMLAFHGATRGIFYGAFLHNLLAPDAESDESRLFLPLLGSIAGSSLGFVLAGKGMELGRAELLGVMGDFGAGLGLASAHIAGLWDDERRKPAASAVTLGMSGLGLAAGAWLSQREHYTRGDAYVLRMQGVLGAQIGMTVAAALADKKEKSYSAGAMTGGVLGAGVGNWLLHYQDFDENAGIFISCAQIAGGLLAGGITYLLDSQDHFDPLVYHSTIALGSLAGHTLLYHTFKLRK